MGNEIEIKKLTPELAEDFLHFFDDIAFCDHLEWSACYCLEGYQDPAEDDDVMELSAKAARRERARKMICSGKMNGYLAYCDGEVAGWCNTDDKQNYYRLQKIDGYWQYGNKTDRVKALYCFTVDPNRRGRGIASAMIRRVCEDARREGYQAVEGYPLLLERDDFPYHGPVSLYEKLGFQLVHQFDQIGIYRLEDKGFIGE